MMIKAIFFFLVIKCLKFVKRIKLACYSLLFWSLRTKGIWKFPCWINLFSLTSPLPFRCSLRIRSVAMMSTLLEVLFGLINLPKTEGMLSVEFYCIKMKRFSLTRLCIQFIFCTSPNERQFHWNKIPSTYRSSPENIFIF